MSTSKQRTEIRHKPDWTWILEELPQFIYEYRKELISVMMKALEKDDDVKLQATIEQASAYKLRLRDKDCTFWLTIVHKIIPHVKIIFKQL